MKSSHTNFLKNTLLANAAFSGTGGLACLVVNSMLTEFIGLADGVYLYVLGAGLILFAADVAYTATRNPVNTFFVKMIIGADIAWVVGSFLLTALMPHLFSFYGIILIEFVAIDVAIFAILQSIGFKRMQRPHPLAV